MVRTPCISFTNKEELKLLKQSRSGFYLMTLYQESNFTKEVWDRWKHVPGHLLGLFMEEDKRFLYSPGLP